MPPARLRWIVLAVLLACSSDDAPAAESVARVDSAARVTYDADSAARGLIEPRLADLLAVEPLLDSAANLRWRCREDTLRQLRHVRRRFDVRSAETATTIFVRATPDGTLRRAEILRRDVEARTALGVSWDAATGRTVVSEHGGRTVKQTTLRDSLAPLTRAMLYVGRRALGTGC